MGDPRSDGNTAKHEEANRCHNFTEFGEDLRRLDVGEEKEFIKRVYWYIWKDSERPFLHLKFTTTSECEKHSGGQ